MTKTILRLRMKKLYLSVAGIFFSLLCLAQQRDQIQGTVTSSADNKPLQGVSVVVKGTDKGSTTDANGHYAITINKSTDKVLVFSFVGYVVKETAISNQAVIDAVLSPMATQLNELVVTGYTKQKKADLTGSIAVVNVADMIKQPSAQVATLLQGQASGVTVISTGQPGEAPEIRIRGINTFGNNTPLYIVDGIPTQDISNINPGDLASIQVLKDAGAASVYGSRASNGVVIITTKRGSGKVKVQYDAFYGRQVPLSGNIYDRLSPLENAQLKWMALKNSGATSFSDPLYGSGAEPVLPDYISPAGAKEGDQSVDPSKYYVNPVFDPSEFGSFYQITRANKQGTDWYHEIMKPTYMTSHNLSVSGGGDIGNYFLSLNYYNQPGVLTYTFAQRYSLRANSEFNISKNIHIGENLEYSFNTGRNVGLVNGIRGAATYAPIIPVYDIEGNFGGAHGTDFFGGNPVAGQYRTKDNKNYSNRLIGNVYASVDFAKDFTFRTSFGGDVRSGYANAFAYPAYEGYTPPAPSNYSESSNFAYGWTWTNTLNYHKIFNAVHDVNVLVGTETVDQRGQSLGSVSQGYFSFDPNFTTLSTGTTIMSNNSGRSAESLFSLFAKLNYSYKGKYLLGATVRRDGSSKFVNNIYGVFPAMSLGWRISEESFMRDIAWINDLKIRGSWGVMGNQLNVSPVNGYYTFISNKSISYYDLYGTNNSIVQGFQVGQIGNPDAKWEKDINSNIGIDATLFNGGLEVTVDYYYKNIKDLLYNPSLIGTIGSSGTPPYVNIAGVKNSGLDLSLGSHVNLTKDLRLNASLSFTTYKNTITKVTDQANYFWTPVRAFGFGTNFIRNEVGHSMGSFYGYKIVGFWNSQAEIDEADAAARAATNDPTAIYQTAEGLGRFRYADINNDGRVDANDRTFLGNPNPKFTYGLNIGLNYHNFDFSVFFYGVQGNQVWNQLKWWLDFYPSYPTGKSKTALYDSWRPDHHDAKVAIQENSGYASTNGAPNSYYIENGSYLRAKNVLLGYTFPESVFKGKSIQKLRIYLQASNLFTITKYSGVDPEVTGSPTNFGVDEGIYPHTREYLLGINLGF